MLSPSGFQAGDSLQLSRCRCLDALRVATVALSFRADWARSCPGAVASGAEQSQKHKGPQRQLKTEVTTFDDAISFCSSSNSRSTSRSRSKSRNRINTRSIIITLNINYKEQKTNNNTNKQNNNNNKHKESYDDDDKS